MSAAICSAPVTVPVWPSRITSAAALAFLPWRRRPEASGHAARALALQAAGMCVPAMAIGFGLTQARHARYGGIAMAGLFAPILSWRCLQGVPRQPRGGQR